MRSDLPAGRALWLNDPAGLDTARTDPYFFGLAILEAPYLLKVGIPAFLGFIMSMADFIADHRFFSANVTNFCHYGVSP